MDSIANTPNTDRRDSLPISFNKRKRKRFSQRIQFEGTPIGSSKRRSSVSDAGLLSVSGSFFDCTTSPDKLETDKLHNEVHIETPTVCETAPAKKSMRFNHFMDFFSTESNYVGILDTIVKVRCVYINIVKHYYYNKLCSLQLFKNPLEEIAETNDALLNKSEIKSIFNNFLPIHEVHQSMLESLRGIQSKWSEDCLIGDIILQHRDELTKAYPPYVNFFEQMKETLQQCDNQNPRFHAFLKINQTKPECGRQSLQDLMIRPVQRLPSISLLLNGGLRYIFKNFCTCGFCYIIVFYSLNIYFRYKFTFMRSPNMPGSLFSRSSHNCKRNYLFNTLQMIYTTKRNNNIICNILCRHFKTHKQKQSRLC